LPTLLGGGGAMPRETEIRGSPPHMQKSPDRALCIVTAKPDHPHSIAILGHEHVTDGHIDRRRLNAHAAAVESPHAAVGAPALAHGESLEAARIARRTASLAARSPGNTPR